MKKIIFAALFLTALKCGAQIQVYEKGVVKGEGNLKAFYGSSVSLYVVDDNKMKSEVYFFKKVDSLVVLDSANYKRIYQDPIEPKVPIIYRIENYSWQYSVPESGQIQTNTTPMRVQINNHHSPEITGHHLERAGNSLIIGVALPIIGTIANTIITTNNPTSNLGVVIGGGLSLAGLIAITDAGVQLMKAGRGLRQHQP